MKIAIIGSRNLTIENLGDYLPSETAEIVSGGARGIDQCAADYAGANGILLTEFLPEYSKYGKSAPLKRNIRIVEYSNLVFAFWDGKSRGTKFVIDYCVKYGIPIEIINM